MSNLPSKEQLAEFQMIIEKHIRENPERPLELGEVGLMPCSGCKSRERGVTHPKNHAVRVLTAVLDEDGNTVWQRGEWLDAGVAQQMYPDILVGSSHGSCPICDEILTNAKS